MIKEQIRAIRPPRRHRRGCSRSFVYPIWFQRMAMRGFSSKYHPRTAILAVSLLTLLTTIASQPNAPRLLRIEDMIKTPSSLIYGSMKPKFSPKSMRDGEPQTFFTRPSTGAISRSAETELIVNCLRLPEAPNGRQNDFQIGKLARSGRY